MYISQDSLRWADEILHIMREHGLTLSTAESCTSGRIAAMLTSVSGASDYFQGGLIAYQDKLKIEHLGVDVRDIAAYDVVSRQVAEQMVRGACRMFHTDMAIASTGYTGTGTAEIPSGTVWIAWGTEQEVHSLCLHEDHGREWNTWNAAQTAVTEFLNYLRTNGKSSFVKQLV